MSFHGMYFQCNDIYQIFWNWVEFNIVAGDLFYSSFFKRNRTSGRCAVALPPRMSSRNSPKFYQRDQTIYECFWQKNWKKYWKIYNIDHVSFRSVSKCQYSFIMLSHWADLAGGELNQSSFIMLFHWATSPEENLAPLAKHPRPSSGLNYSFNGMNSSRNWLWNSDNLCNPPIYMLNFKNLDRFCKFWSLSQNSEKCSSQSNVQRHQKYCE